MSDSLYLIDFDQGAAHVDIEHKGGYVPVALAEAGELVFHFRSPTEAGDLWRCTASLLKGIDDVPFNMSKTRAERLTHTMPPALRAKLRAPEVRVKG